MSNLPKAARCCRSLPGTQPGSVRYQDSPALRCQWLSAELYPLDWAAGRFAQLYPLLDQVRLPGSQGRPRKRCRMVIADKGYDSEELRRYCDRFGMQPVIAQRTMHRKPRPGLPCLFDRPKYQQRNVIERLFSWLKEKRRLCTRFDKLASSFKAMVTVACIEQCMRADFSDKS